jgi:hypothetical protein
MHMEQVLVFCVTLKRIFLFVTNAENAVDVESHYKILLCKDVCLLLPQRVAAGI